MAKNSNRLTDDELRTLGVDIIRLQSGGGISDFNSAYERLITCYFELLQRRAEPDVLAEHRETIKRAMKLLHDEEDYYAGMSILAGLANMPDDSRKLFKSLKRIPLQKLAARPNSRFKATLPKRRNRA